MGKRSRLSCFKKWQKMTLPHGMSLSEDANEPAAKRARTDHHEHDQLDAETASVLVGAANEQYDVYSAKIAAETVEAVGLPNVV
jgi:hypothetical protein